MLCFSGKQKIEGKKKNKQKPKETTTKKLLAHFFLSLFPDLSSASEISDNDSEDSEGRDLSGYSCRHCFTTSKLKFIITLLSVWKKMYFHQSATGILYLVDS